MGKRKILLQLWFASDFVWTNRISSNVQWCIVLPAAGWQFNTHPWVNAVTGGWPHLNPRWPKQNTVSGSLQGTDDNGGETEKKSKMHKQLHWTESLPTPHPLYVGTHNGCYWHTYLSTYHDVMPLHFCLFAGQLLAFQLEAAIWRENSFSVFTRS